MKKIKCIKRGIGIFLMIFGIIIIFSRNVFTGAVIGISNIYYFGLIGFIMFLVGAFLSLEDIISGFKKKREEERREKFKHRLNMGRVTEPIAYVFNDQNYDKKMLRDILKRTSMLSKSDDEYLRKKELKQLAKAGGFYSPRRGKFLFRRGSQHRDRPSTYAHELLHHFGKTGLVSNDYITANAITTYIDDVKEHWKPEYSQADLGNLGKYLSKMRNPQNIRPLKPEEKKRGGKEEDKYRDTGSDIGMYAAFIEGVSKKTGSGLYFIKLVSEGYSPEKARDTVLGNYKPLKEFQEKYGKRWRRVLEK